MYEESHSHYDIPTAVTFFLAGLGVGSLLALFIAPRENSGASDSARLSPQKK